MSEEFQAILTMVGEAGEGAWTLAVIYLSIEAFKFVGVAVTWLIVAFIAGKTVNHVVMLCTGWNELRREAGCSRTSEYITDSERRKVLELVRAGVEEQKNE